MRLLHTSDWHLGRSLHRADLGPAQEAFVDHVVDAVSAESLDAVLIAGDVYDRAVPPLASVELFDDALARIRAAGAQVVVISGNHDSPPRLGVGSRLLDGAGVHLCTRVADCGRPVLLSDEHGEVAVYALPYLEPDAVRSELGPDVGRSHEAVITAALARVAADRAERHVRRCVLMAHGWVSSGETSDSERDIAVGGVGIVPAALFGGVDYVALGHLHRPQRISERIRYSGSALPYSFSEGGQQKGSWLVELDADGTKSIDFVETPVHRRLTTLTGDLEDLLNSADFASYDSDFIAISLTDVARPREAMDRLRLRFPHILTLSWSAPNSDDGASYRGRLVGRSDLQLTEDFVLHVRGTAADDSERALLADALTAIRVSGTN